MMLELLLGALWKFLSEARALRLYEAINRTELPRTPPNTKTADVDVSIAYRTGLLGGRDIVKMRAYRSSPFNK